MKRLELLLFTFLIFFPVASGQSAEGRYASRMTVNGTIFFIDPHKLGELTNISRFEYDMTLLSWSDSVTVNFSFESDIMTMPENLQIISCGEKYHCHDYSSLFIDIKKNHFEIRITSKFKYSDIARILECESSPVFSFTQEGRTETASYKRKIWTKDRKKLKDIFAIYEYSKK